MRLIGIGSLLFLLFLFLLTYFHLVPIPPLSLNLFALLSLSIGAYRLGQITYSKRVGQTAMALTLLFPAHLVYLFSPSFSLVYAAFSLWALSFCWRSFSAEGAKMENLLGAGTIFACLLFFAFPFFVLAFPLAIAARLQNTAASIKLLLPLLFFLFSFSGLALFSSLAPYPEMEPLLPLSQQFYSLFYGSAIFAILLSLYYGVKTCHVGFVHKYDSFFGWAAFTLLLCYFLVPYPSLLLSSVPLLLIYSSRCYFLKLSRYTRP